MTHTIDTLMALADAYAAQWANGYDYPKKLREELHAALTEALSQPPTIGTKTWMEGGVMMTQNLTASDIYKPPQAAQPVAIEFEDLLDMYWDLAYAEGHSHNAELYGNKANEVRHKLRSLKGAQPVREPLLSSEIDAIYDSIPEYAQDGGWMITFTRAIERAHGIGDV